MMRQSSLEFPVEALEIERSLTENRRHQVGIDVDSDPFRRLTVRPRGDRSLSETDQPFVGDELHHHGGGLVSATVRRSERLRTRQADDSGFDFNDLHSRDNPSRAAPTRP